jgi:hypothetical protein
MSGPVYNANETAFCSTSPLKAPNRLKFWQCRTQKLNTYLSLYCGAENFENNRHFIKYNYCIINEVWHFFKYGFSDSVTVFYATVKLVSQREMLTFLFSFLPNVCRCSLCTFLARHDPAIDWLFTNSFTLILHHWPTTIMLSADRMCFSLSGAKLIAHMTTIPT